MLCVIQAIKLEWWISICGHSTNALRQSTKFSASTSYLRLRCLGYTPGLPPWRRSVQSSNVERRTNCSESSWFPISPATRNTTSSWSPVQLSPNTFNKRAEVGNRPIVALGCLYIAYVITLFLLRLTTCRQLTVHVHKRYTFTSLPSMRSSIVLVTRAFE